MELGFASMNTVDELAPDRMAQVLEERGFGALFVGEHSHIPVSRRTPYPAGGELPEPYYGMMDPYVSLAVAAAASTELRIGTGVALPLERDLLALAKTVATLDRVSGGRLLFGVGVGWNEEELANHRPIPWSERYRALEEAVTALGTLWRDDEPEFHGAYYDFDAVRSEPKPHQRPRPPVLVGVAGPLGIAHAVRWGDGWMPMDVALGDVARKVGRFREAVAEAGRPDVPITMVTWGDPPAERLHEYRELGIERVVLGAAREGWADPASTMPFLDRYGALAAELR